MARFAGKVGFGSPQTIVNGIVQETIVERQYYGNVGRHIWRTKSSDKVNEDVDIDDQISIIADPFAIDNIHLIRYVIFNGSKRAVKSITVQRPRMIIEIGGLYSGG